MSRSGSSARFAERFGVEPEAVELEQVGLNHLTWIRAVRVEGVDRLPELLAEDGEELAADVRMPVERLRAEGAIPSYYLRYYNDEATVVAEAKAKPTRAEEVMSIERDLLELYRDPTLDTKPELLEHRGGAFYSEAAGQLMRRSPTAAATSRSSTSVTTGPCPDLAADDVVEVPARIDRDGAHPLPQAPLAPVQADLVRRVKAYERLAVRAATTGDRGVARQALAANPLAGGPALAEELLEAILAANRRWLPRFFPDG